MTEDVKVEVKVLIFSVIDLQLRGYNGRNSGKLSDKLSQLSQLRGYNVRNSGHCTPEHLGVADDDNDDNSGQCKT